MGNPLKGEASVTIGADGDGGETLRLVVDNDALVAWEEVSGRPFWDMFGELAGAELAEQAPRIGTVRGLLFGATRRHHAALTLSDCGDRVVRHGRALIGPLTDALVAALPQAKADAPGEANAPAPRTTRTPARKRGTGTAS